MAGRGCSGIPSLLEEVLVRFAALLACSIFAACSHRTDSAIASKELIPAEWTVSEDTSAVGDVTTASLQLPASRQISGLVADQQSRLVLRCIDHRMEAFIVGEQGDSSAGADPATEEDTGVTVVPIQLDSAPACD
jgi:hypothetical protein